MTPQTWVRKHLTSEEPKLLGKSVSDFIEALTSAGPRVSRYEFWKLYAEIDERNQGLEDRDSEYHYNLLWIRLQFCDQYSEVWGHREPIPLPELQTKVTTGGKEIPSALIQLGGLSERVQNPEVPAPICPECDQDMVLLAQLNSASWELEKKFPVLSAYQYGDSGRIYLQFCPGCLEFHVDWDCH